MCTTPLSKQNRKRLFPRNCTNTNSAAAAGRSCAISHQRLTLNPKTFSSWPCSPGPASGGNEKFRLVHTYVVVPHTRITHKKTPEGLVLHPDSFFFWGRFETLKFQCRWTYVRLTFSSATALNFATIRGNLAGVTKSGNLPRRRRLWPFGWDDLAGPTLEISLWQRRERVSLDQQHLGRGMLGGKFEPSLLLSRWQWTKYMENVVSDGFGAVNPFCGTAGTYHMELIKLFKVDFMALFCC